MGKRRIITYKGRSMGVHDWCRETGVAYDTACGRIERGIPDLQAVGLEPYRRRYRQGKRKHQVSICLDCQNARADRCIWVRKGIPIEGWTAEKDKLTCPHGYVETYRVLDCPNFREDGR